MIVSRTTNTLHSLLFFVWSTQHFSVSGMPPLEIPKGIFDTYRLNTKLKEKNCIQFFRAISIYLSSVVLLLGFFFFFEDHTWFLKNLRLCWRATSLIHWRLQLLVEGSCFLSFKIVWNMFSNGPGSWTSQNFSISSGPYSFRPLHNAWPKTFGIDGRECWMLCLL